MDSQRETVPLGGQPLRVVDVKQTTPPRLTQPVRSVHPTVPLSELPSAPVVSAVPPVEAYKPPDHTASELVHIQEQRRSKDEAKFPSTTNKLLTEQSREAQAVHTEWLRRTRDHVDSPFHSMEVMEQFNPQGELRNLIVRRKYNPDGLPTKGFYTEKRVTFRPGGRISGIESTLIKYQDDGRPQELDSHTVKEQTTDVGEKREPYKNPFVERVAQAIETVLSPKYDPDGRDILRTGFVQPPNVVLGRRGLTLWERVRDFNFTGKGTVPESWVGGYSKDLKVIHEAQQAIETSLHNHQQHLALQKTQVSPLVAPPTVVTPKPA